MGTASSYVWQKNIENDLDLHNNVKKKVVETIRNNTEFYKQYMDGDMNAHLVNISRSYGSIQSWATEADIMAASQIYGADIYI